MTTAIAFSYQNDAGSSAHFLVLRKSRPHSRPRLKIERTLSISMNSNILMLHSRSARRMLQVLRYSGASSNSCSSSLESPDSEKEEFMVSSTLLNTRSCHYILTRSKYLHTLLSSWLKKKTFKKWAHSCHHWGLSVWVLLQVTDVKCGPLTFIHLDFDFKISLLMVQGRLKSMTLVSCYRLICLPEGWPDPERWSTSSASPAED